MIAMGRNLLRTNRGAHAMQTAVDERLGRAAACQTLLSDLLRCPRCYIMLYGMLCDVVTAFM